MLGVAQEAQVARDEPGGLLVAAGRAEDRDEQGPADVIGAVAVRALRHPVRGVLEHPDVVGERPQVSEARRGDSTLDDGDRARLVPGHDLGEQRLVGPSDGRPGHGSAVHAGPLAHLVAA